MPEDHDKDGKGDLTDASKEKSIIHPIAIDQLLEALRKMVDEKNAVNLASTLASCSMDRRSSSVATQFKTLSITTFESPTSVAPKVTLPISNPPSMLTLEQVQKMMEERVVMLIDGFYTMQNNANLKKPIDTTPIAPSGPIPVSSTPKIFDFPYGMPMNYPKGQVGPYVGVVGTNAIVVHPTYTNPIASVSQIHNVHNSGNDDRISELAGFESPYIDSMSYGPGIPPRALVNPLVLFILMFLIND